MTPTTIILLSLGAIFLLFIGVVIGRQIGRLKAERDLMARIPKIREDATKRSRAVLAGNFSEQLAPFLPDFPYNPSDAKFMGKPIDFIVFKGLDDKHIKEVVFVEIKSSNSQLSKTERSLKEAITKKKVSFEEYRIPKDLTNK